MKTNFDCWQRASEAAKYVRSAMRLAPSPSAPVAHTAVILGTGWGGKLRFAPSRGVVPLRSIPGFDGLGEVPGHARILGLGDIRGRSVLVLDGRVHLNEAPASPEIHRMVRLQVEMLAHLGVRRLILTAAAGSLLPNIHVGTIVIVDGFVTLYAPDMPLWGGEFCSPEDTLTRVLRTKAMDVKTDLLRNMGGYAMVRGPFFEGRTYDKAALKATGASVVGMSMLPEACIASLYGVEVLGFAFVTNTAYEEHSHEENQQRANASAALLGGYLTDIIRAL